MTINEIFSTIRDWAVGKFQPKGDYASSKDIPKKISELENDEGFISAVPDGYVTEADLETKGYLTEESDPTVPDWAKQPLKPTYSKADVGLENADNTSDVSKPVSTAQQAAIDAAYQQATAYADRIVNALVNGAPSTLDTLGEIAAAMQESADVVDALEQAIGSKASEADFTGHVNNTTVHTTASEKATWNNKMEKTGDASNTTATFTQAFTRTNIASGEKVSVIFGKVMKFFSDLKTVAFSGSYNDLSNKPTIPTVGNGTLTIQKNGTNVQTFSANQGTAATANITVPTKTSELTNDSGYKTTDNNNAVTQTNTDTTNADYRVLFSATADDTTRTEGARKDKDLKYNPSTGTLSVSKVIADMADNTVTFTSGDAASPTGWADVETVTSGEKLSSLMRKFSLAVKNLRYIWKMIGNTQLSVGDGTITGTISALNTDIGKITYPYGALNDVRLYGFVSKKQMDITGSAERYIVFVPTMTFSGHLYGVKTIKEIVVQGMIILRQDGKNINGYVATNAIQTNQGIIMSFEASSNSPDISGYLCDCVFDFYMVD